MLEVCLTIDKRSKLEILLTVDSSRRVAITKPLYAQFVQRTEVKSTSKVLPKGQNIMVYSAMAQRWNAPVKYPKQEKKNIKLPVTNL